MYQSTMTKDGRVTIPAKLRKELGLEPNVKIEVTARPDGSMVLLPQNRPRIGERKSDSVDSEQA